MATTHQGGPGLSATRFPLYPADAFALSGQNTKQTAVNRVALTAGQIFNVPAGQFYVTPGPYTFVQQKDACTGTWTTTTQTPNVSRYISSDGGNYRIANLTGCAIGAFITNVGSGYTSAPTVTASAGSSAWTAIVGGAINSTVTITTAGAGYSHRPMLIVEPPPAGGVQATAVCTVSAGAIATVVVVDQGAGYATAPGITIVPDPRDTVTTQAVLTVNSTLAGAGTITAILCTDHGTPLTAVPTFTISGGGGASGAATAVMCFTATGFSVDNGGAVYGNAQPFLITAAGGRVAGTAGAVVNPSTGVGLLTPRTGFITGTSTAGGAVTATGAVVEDGGLFSRVPTGFVTAAGTAALPTTTAIVTITVGGVTDVCFLQPA